jgi:hypothetical protein
MSRKLGPPIAGAALFALATPAHADFVLDTEGTTSISPIPGPNEPGDNKYKNDLENLGYDGLVIGGDAQTLQVDADAKLTFEFHAIEARYTNGFEIGRTEVLSKTADDTAWMNPGDQFTTRTVDAGSPLDWGFTSDSGNDADLGGPGFGIFTQGTAGLPDDGDVPLGQEVFLGFDDAGAGLDDNHDDLVVSVKEVPIPGTLALIAAGVTLVATSVRVGTGAGPASAQTRR